MNLPKTSPFSQKEKTFPVGENSLGRRGEVDTSTPFESVKDAVDRFGGSALWNSQLKMLFFPKKRHCFEELEVLNVEEQADQLDYFEPQLQKEETSEVNKIPVAPPSSVKFHHISQKEKENPFIGALNAVTIKGQSSDSILDELELAKMNLSRTTCDLTKIRAFIETLYNEIDSEKTTIQEKTPEKLSSLGTIVSFLEEDLKKTTLKLQFTNETNDNLNRDPTVICREIKQLRSQTEQFRQTAIASKSEASNLTSEIEKMQSCIKTAEIRRLAAKKMEEAAKAAEAIAISRMKDIMNNSEENVMVATPEFEEHFSRKKIESFPMLDVETSNISNLGLLTKVKEAAAEVKTSRKVLEDALNRLEAANSMKMAAEGTLWRLPECGEKTHSSSTKRMLEINGLNLRNHNPKSGLKHALSIGEILRKKLIGLEEYEHAIIEICERPDEKSKLSFGQLLNRKPGLLPPLLVAGFACKQQPLNRKRKKFGFVSSLNK